LYAADPYAPALVEAASALAAAFATEKGDVGEEAGRLLVPLVLLMLWVVVVAVVVVMAASASVLKLELGKRQ
jgi:branched-subunit amino acid permease